MGNGFLINFYIAIIKAIAQGTLSCSVTTGSCSGDIVFRMSSTDNAHASFHDTSNPSIYPYKVCCTGATSTTRTCSDTNEIIRIHSEPNDYVETPSYTTSG